MPKRDIRALKPDLNELLDNSNLPTQHVPKADEKAQTTTTPKKAAAPKKPATKPVAGETERPIKLTFHIRPSLRKALAQKALDDDTTMQSVLLLGLKKLGLPVIDEDLRDSRKKDQDSI